MTPPGGPAAAVEPGNLLAALRGLAGQPTGRLQCCVAFSGGLDSCVLLHLLLQARARAPGALALRAVHVDHGLQPAAVDFRRHARRVARAARVPLTVLRARLPPVRGRSMEEVAREARYAALRADLSPGELLLTAQHADDQLETVLMALLRGSGPAGLAGIAPVSPFGPGLLLRPLLAQSRAGLLALARAAHLDWIEDPSNASPRFDRNYLRGQVLPALRVRWPAAAATVARSARHCGDAAAVETARARRDLEAAADGEALEAAVLRRWDPARQRAALRCWCRLRGVRVPDERRLQQGLRMLEVREDASPLLEWPGARLRLHRGRLLLQPVQVQRAGEPGAAADPRAWDWRRHRSLRLEGRGTLLLRRDARGDLDLARLPEQLLVRWPRSFEARGPGDSQRTLRKQLQALGIPAWERDRLPLVCEVSGVEDGDRVVAIADLWLHPRLQAQARARHRARLVWRPMR